MSEVWQHALTLDAAGIEACIPHAGCMSLLQEVCEANEQGLTALASSHRKIDNPLRQQGRLGAACGVEYAAQAMALHGALMAQAQADESGTGLGVVRGGYLVNVRDLQLLVHRLDDVATDLLVQIRQADINGAFSIYSFSLFADEQPPRVLLEGTAYVLLQALATGDMHGQ